MPNNFTPTDPLLTRDVRMAIDTFGNASKMMILRVVHANPGIYFGRIRDNIPGIIPGTLSRHLRDLETAGVIEADLPETERRGRSPRYTSRPERIYELYTRHALYLGITPNLFVAE